MSSQAAHLTFGAVSLWLAVGCHPSPAPTSAASPSPRAARQALRAQAMTAYTAKEWKTCAALFDQAHAAYGAASCMAQGGDLEGAFARLSQAIDRGDLRDQNIATDSDLDPLHGDPRWQSTLDHLAASNAERRKTLNGELIEIYDQDQADRNVGAYEQIDWGKVNPRDEARRKRVDEIIAAGGARAADDYFHAAMVYQHGNAGAEIQRAHDLAVKAVELDPTLDNARWLAAAAEDRKLMYDHKAQKWGTQYKKVDGVWILWPVDPRITDAQRAEWNVPPLSEAEAHAAEMNASK
jgi:hypothetical protein